MASGFHDESIDKRPGEIYDGQKFEVQRSKRHQGKHENIRTSQIIQAVIRIPGSYGAASIAAALAKTLGPHFPTSSSVMCQV